MKSLLTAALILMSVSAGAEQAWLSNLAFGPSVPQSDPQNNIQGANTSFDQGGAPTRYSGGEKITIRFMDTTTQSEPWKS